MRDNLDRGSGSLASVMTIAVLVALAFGLLAGVTVIRRATESLRTAEREAVSAATLLSEGDPSPCERVTTPVAACHTSGLTATVTVTLNGATATAEAGPAR